MPFLPTPKWALRVLTGASVGSDIDAGFQALADDIEPKLTPFSSGLFDARPISTPAQPGKAGQEYLATDRGVLYKDYGTGWIALNEEIGDVKYSSIDAIPPGGTHVEANGQAISRTNYPLYMSLIGTKHGAGDGSSTVNVPDAGGRVLVGRDVGAVRIPNSPRAVGQAGGEERHGLTVGEMPAHGHGVNDPGHNHKAWVSNDDTNPDGGTADTANAANHFESTSHIFAATTGISIQNAGGGAGHNNLQPYLILLPLVRVA